MRTPYATFRRLRMPARAIVLVIAMIIFGAMLAAPVSVLAHARLVSSTPVSGTALAAMPGEIVLTFSEEIDPAFSSASLLGTDNVSISFGPFATSADGRDLTVPVINPASVPPGTYTLVWRVLSAVDGHVTTGTVAFSAGTGVAPSAAGGGEVRPPWWRVGLRWLELTGLALSAGLFLFGLLIARQQVGNLPPRIRELGRVAPSATLVVLAISAYDLGIRATGARFFAPPGPATYRDLLTDTTSGRTLLFIALCAAVTVSLAATESRRRLINVVGVGTALAALLAVSVAGHAAAASPAWRAILVDWVHFAAVACWFGVLPYLWLSLRAPDSDEHAATLVSRFSRFGLGLISLIALSGIVRASWEVAGSRTLVESDYGRVLVVKHLLIAPILIVAGVNLLVLVPRLRRAGEIAIVESVRRFIAIEVAAAMLVLIAAATLTELAPANAPLPVDVATRPATIDQRARAGDLDLWLLARLAGGANDRYTITVIGPDGRAPADMQRVIVETRTSVRGAQAGDRFDAAPLSGPSGTFVFPALRLGLPGAWDLTFVVRRAGLEDVAGSFSIDTTDTGTRPPALINDDWRLPRLTLPAWLFGFLALASLFGGLIAVRKLTTLEPFAAAILLTMTALITAGFAVQGYRQTIPVSAGTNLTNPVPADPGSIQRGEDLYRSLCLQCHGEGAVGLETEDPEHTHSGANLRDRRSKSQRDGDLYWTITNGAGGTEMPAYGPALTDQERWDLVNYLRSLDGAPVDS